jgi:hypothetical protein
MRTFWLVALTFATLLGAGSASAGLGRAISLVELARLSRHAIVGVPLGGYSVHEVVGGRSRIVTYTRIRVEESLAGEHPATSELVVRTLGGRVGDIAEIVHGAARLEYGRHAVVFLRPVSNDVLAVTAETQGYYALERQGQGAPLLRSSRELAALIDAAQGAVVRLRGRSLSEARALIREAFLSGAREPK